MTADLTETRRLKYIPLTGEFLTGLFTAGNEIRVDVVEGIPEDSEFRRIEYDGDRDFYHLIVWSSEFDPVSEGALMPEAEVDIRVVDVE